MIQVSQNPCEADFVLESCGETLGIIWLNRNLFNKIIYHSLQPDARWGVDYVVKSRKPEWIEQYQLNDDGFKN